MRVAVRIAAGLAEPLFTLISGKAKNISGSAKQRGISWVNSLPGKDLESRKRKVLSGREVRESVC
jgi:hypothetical protein